MQSRGQLSQEGSQFHVVPRQEKGGTLPRAKVPLQIMGNLAVQYDSPENQCRYHMAKLTSAQIRIP